MKVIVVLMLLIVGIYFVPTLVAISRNHLQKVAIIVLNIFLGWTFLGWVVALVWACTNSSQKYRNEYPYYNNNRM